MSIGEWTMFRCLIAAWWIVGVAVPSHAGPAEGDGRLTEAEIREHAVIKSDRPDGRYMSGRGFTQYLMKHTRPRLQFDPWFSVARREAW